MSKKIAKYAKKIDFSTQICPGQPWGLPLSPRTLPPGRESSLSAALCQLWALSPLWAVYQEPAPPAPPHKKPPPFPVLAGLAALFSAAVANNVVQLQAAVQSVRSVFAGGADSLLHHLPVGSVLSEQQELLVAQGAAMSGGAVFCVNFFPFALVFMKTFMPFV